MRDRGEEWLLPWILGECILVSKAVFHVMVTVAIRSRVEGSGL